VDQDDEEKDGLVPDDPRMNSFRWRARDQSTWKRQTRAATNTSRSATLRLVLAPPTRWIRMEPGSTITATRIGSATKMPKARTTMATARPARG